MERGGHADQRKITGTTVQCPWGSNGTAAGPKEHTPCTGLCEICIDNTGVVDTWDNETLDNPIARLRSTGRALWNRIQLLKRAMQRVGSRTWVQWVPSHVDASSRQQAKATSRHKCACQGANMKCSPSHQHHKGNEAADKLATEGMEGEEPRGYNLRCSTGDEHFALMRQGRLCQGDMSESLKGAAMDARRERNARGHSE